MDYVVKLSHPDQEMHTHAARVQHPVAREHKDGELHSYWGCSDWNEANQLAARLRAAYPRIGIQASPEVDSGGFPSSGTVQ